MDALGETLAKVEKRAKKMFAGVNVGKTPQQMQIPGTFLLSGCFFYWVR